MAGFVEATFGRRRQLSCRPNSIGRLLFFLRFDKLLAEAPADETALMKRLPDELRRSEPEAVLRCAAMLAKQRGPPAKERDGKGKTAAMKTSFIELPPTKADLALARWLAGQARPSLESSTKLVTYLADERLVVGATLGFWAACHASSSGAKARHGADQLMLGAALATILPHLIKRFVDRERPDRRVVHGRRHGIPRSGNKWDSFPSGHAVQLGTLATLGYRLAGRRVRPLLWPAALVLAATRIVLLAHYASDVAAGLVLGAMVGRTAAATLSNVDRGRGLAARYVQG